MFHWSKPYQTGQKVSQTQAFAAYAAYYGMDDSCDELNLAGLDESEAPAIPRAPLCGYASMTGTRRNLAVLDQAGWRVLLSPAGSLDPKGRRFALDNGAWSAFQQGRAFDGDAFLRAADKVGEHADWIVLPDIVMGGQASLDLSLSWLEKLDGLPSRLLIAVQNGFEVDDVRHYLNPSVGLFVGGDTEWKERTTPLWGSLARRRNCYLHVGRVNSQRRIGICAAAGADSFDGTSVTRYAVTMRPLDAARRQSDLFAASSIWTDM